MVKSGLVLACVALAQWVSAQQAPQMEALPIDPNVRYGVLDNGLTYYVRHNETPKNRAEFHIAQKVGSILENEDQRGLAHFLEHMAFNGTEHFPGKNMLNYLENKGIKSTKNAELSMKSGELVPMPTGVHGKSRFLSCLPVANMPTVCPSEQWKLS